MTTYTWHDVKPFLLDEYDLAGTGETTLEIDVPGWERVVEDSTGVGGSGWETSKLTGEKKATGPLDFTAFYDQGSDPDTSAALVDEDGSIRAFTVGVEGGTSGTRAVIAKAYQTMVRREGTKGTLLKVKASLKPTGRVYDEARILKALAAVTTTGNTEASSVDNGAATSDGGLATFHARLVTLGTATGLALKVRHSTDNITFVDLATSSTFTADGGEAVEVAAGTTVNRYLAASWTYSGTPSGSTTATVAVAFGRA